MCRIISSGRDAFGGCFVMGTSRSVHMMITGIPVVVGELDPALQTKRFGVPGRFRNNDVALVDSVLGSACVGNGIFTGWQRDRLAVMSIDLIVGKRNPGASRRDFAGYTRPFSS